MSRIQQVISRLVPAAGAASMEAESREWMVRCRSCGFARSIWGLGGIHRKGSGKSWTWGRCPSCGKLSVHRVYRRDPPASPPAPQSVACDPLAGRERAGVDLLSDVPTFYSLLR
jgi:hypothetical protein